MHEKTLTRKSQIELWISKVCRNDGIDLMEDMANKATVFNNVMFLRKFPLETYGFKLHKARAQMMMEAIRIDSTRSGNLDVHFEISCFVFSYRGTPILKWDTAFSDEIGVFDIDSGIYEGTPSTHNQRKVARQAINEFQNAVLRL
jgi:hypothetical protein